MDFEATLEQILQLVQHQGRVSYRAIRRRFALDEADFEDLKKEILTLKGVATPLKVYQVRQASTLSGRLDSAAAKGFSPFVGRSSEASLLLERWEQASGGMGQVVLLSGEAGLGKSRPAWQHG